MSYTNRDYIDMIWALGACKSNLLATVRYYRERYPNRRVPDRRTIVRVQRSLLEHECFAPWRPDCGRMQQWALIEDNVLEDIDTSPAISVTSLSRNYGVSERTIRRILRDNRVYPHHVTRTRALSNRDYVPHEWYFHIGYLNNMIVIHNLRRTFYGQMRHNSADMVLLVSIIHIYGPPQILMQRKRPVSRKGIPLTYGLQYLVIT